MKYVIMGNPKALERPRYNYRTRTVYDNQKNERLVLGITLQSQHGTQPFYIGPTRLTAHFYMPMPLRMPISQDDTYHYYKPDLDNMIKLLCDISNGILFKDDSIICEIFAKKLYSIQPRTEFFLEEINGKKKRKYKA